MHEILHGELATAIGQRRDLFDLFEIHDHGTVNAKKRAGGETAVQLFHPEIKHVLLVLGVGIHESMFGANPYDFCDGQKELFPETLDRQPVAGLGI